MTAHDNLSEPQFFHGSDSVLREGDTIDPVHMRPWAAEIGKTDKNYTFAAGRQKYAQEYGEHVYKVEPTGPYETDKHTPRSSKSIRSEHPMRVVGEA